MSESPVSTFTPVYPGDIKSPTPDNIHDIVYRNANIQYCEINDIVISLTLIMKCCSAVLGWCNMCLFITPVHLILYVFHSVNINREAWLSERLHCSCSWVFIVYLCSVLWSPVRSVYPLVLGKTMNSDKHFMDRLRSEVKLHEVDSQNDCDVLIAFVPIVSRAGTDIQAALERIPSKHTFIHKATFTFTHVFSSAVSTHFPEHVFM